MSESTVKELIINNFTPEISFKGKKLTDKQIMVLELLAQGLTNLEMSKQLFLSVRTIESHISRIRDIISEKLNVSGRISDRQLVLFAKDFIEGLNVFKVLKEKELETDLSEFKSSSRTVYFKDNQYFMK